MEKHTYNKLYEELSEDRQALLHLTYDKDKITMKKIKELISG